MHRFLALLLPAAGLLAACGDNQAQPDAAIAADAAVDSPTSCTPTAKLESMMSGDLVIDTTQTANQVNLTVPMNRSVLFTSLRENEPSPKYGGVICELRDADTANNIPAGVLCSRNTAGTDTGSGTITVHWTVATFSAGVTVQRGEADTGQANPAVVTLATSADPTKSFVLLGGMYNGGSGWGNNEFVRARLLDAQTLDLRTNFSGTAVSWQVVTIDGASVHRGTSALGMTDTQATAAVTAPAGSVVLATYTTDNASGIAAATMMMTAALSGNQLTFKRDLGGSALDVAWEVVALPFASTSKTTTFAATEATKSETLTGFTADKSVAIASAEPVFGAASGSTSYAGADLDLLGEAAFTLTTTATGVDVQRATSQATASVTWTAVDFSRPQCVTQ